MPAAEERGGRQSLVVGGWSASADNNEVKERGGIGFFLSSLPSNKVVLEKDKPVKLSCEL